MAPVDAVWREAGGAEISEHRCRIGEAETVVERIGAVRGRRGRRAALDDQYRSPVDDSKSRSKPIGFTCCWMISFIRSGIICPDPEVEIITFALTGWSGPYPVSFSNFFALSGS